MASDADGQETPKSKHFTPDEDRQIWQYLIGQPGGKELNLKFWEDFKNSTGTSRSTKGLQTRFRNILSQKLHTTEFDDKTKMDLYAKYLIPIDKDFKIKMDRTMDIEVDHRGRIVDYAYKNQNNNNINDILINGSQNAVNTAQKRDYIESSGPLVPLQPLPKLARYDPDDEEEEADLRLGCHVNVNVKQEPMDYADLLEDEPADHENHNEDDGEETEMQQEMEQVVDAHMVDYDALHSMVPQMVREEQVQHEVDTSMPMLAEQVNAPMSYEQHGYNYDPTMAQEHIPHPMAQVQFSSPMAQEEYANPMAQHDISHFFDSLKNMVVDATKQTMLEITSKLVEDRKKEQAKIQDSKIDLHFFLTGLKAVADSIDSEEMNDIKERINTAIRVDTNEAVPLDSIRSVLDVALKLFQY